MRKLKWLLGLSLVAQASLAAPQVEVHRLRPQSVGLGADLARLINHFHTPVIYQATLDPSVVANTLPTPLVPRLKRPTEGFKGVIDEIFLNPSSIRRFRSILRRVDTPAPIADTESLAAVFEENQPFNLAITGNTLSFAPTGLGFGKGIVSKHAVIASDFNDVRFAGFLWREGQTLCYNGNSGTYMKHRDEALELNDGPKDEAALAVIASVFEPSLKVQLCRDIAPTFGAHEAIDQAEKAEAVMKIAEHAMKLPKADPKDVQELAKRMAKLQANALACRDTAAIADRELARWNRAGEKSRELAERRYYDADRVAGEQSQVTKKARHKVEAAILKIHRS